MAINRLLDPTDPPAANADWTRMKALVVALLLHQEQPLRVIGSNVVKGALFQIGGTAYLVDADTAITGTPSEYVKITPSGDGSTCSAAFVSSLTGVTWNSTYNGYYDSGSPASLYIFDEGKAFTAEQIAAIRNTKNQVITLGDDWLATLAVAIGAGWQPVLAAAIGAGWQPVLAAAIGAGWQPVLAAAHNNLRGSLYGPGSTKTHADLYDALAPLLPNIGDEIMVSGCVYLGAIVGIVSKITRHNATTLYLYYTSTTGGGAAYTSVIEDDATAYSNINIAW